MNLYRNPFIVALWGPAYLLAATVAITNDFLMAAMFIMGTLGVIGAYVSDFPLMPTLYMNEVAHKTALSSLLGIMLGLVLFLAFLGGSDVEDSSPMSPGGKFGLTWLVMSTPSYPLMVYFITKVNKRDLEGEEKRRKEKREEQRKRGGGPPIMDRDSF
ncbi:MAG: hypothetical protein G3M78_13205 [Candidatus Nitrohelix vancouverensis]|uniref:Uncharacterized protein n=1 Tax=Candidatus Nitrohelix vancouverensis TaxID=2705534 RepID=A0A7T0C4D9_9BACT|nr:MAG: hypothetical protein G3M78_13205 [Candidatus Nitrohelix vancouverensis]